jgi:hypothetical protein
MLLTRSIFMHLDYHKLSAEMLSLLLTQITNITQLEAYNENTIYRTTNDTFKYDLES